MLNWKKLWQDFARWFDKDFGQSWEAQQKKIQQLVRKYQKIKEGKK